MFTVCPTCKTSIGLKQLPPITGATIRCSNCSSLFRLVPKKKSLSSATVNTSMFPISVVVAIEDRLSCSGIEKVLGGGFSVQAYHDGPAALAAIERLKPHVAVIDVALPGLYGFQVCEAIRNNPSLASVMLIIITAAYDTRRYVRTPASLYGADALIEKHNIPGSLKDLVQGLVSRTVDAGSPGMTSLSVRAEEIRPSSDLTGSTGTEMEGNNIESAAREAIREDHKKAQRLARLIVSDIALYNKSQVEEGVRNGTFYKVLDDDIREGRALYERRIPEELRRCTSYLDDAFTDLIARNMKEA